MSMDRSLRSASSLTRHRNVLSRAERLAVLKDEEKWDESKSVYGLPKVAHRKQEVGGKEKTEAAPAEGAAAAAPAAGGAAKAAAPAAAGKAAAPAAKGKK